MKEEQINKTIQDEKLDTYLISDGYHTFKELYQHRMILFILLCNHLHGEFPVWKSLLHSDGTMFDGDWFVAGINKEKGKQVTYHLRKSIYWDKLNVVR